MDTETFLKVKDVVDDLLAKKKYDEAKVEIKASSLDQYYKSKLFEHIEYYIQKFCHMVSSEPIRKDSISMEQPCTKHGAYHATRYDCPVCWP